MSYHSNPTNPGPPAIQHTLTYLLSLKVCRGASTRPDQLASKILAFMASTLCGKRPCKPSHAALGRMFGRSDRSIRRAVKTLCDAGIIERRRRGRKLSNVYRLAKWFWERLTGRDRRPAYCRGRSQPIGDLLSHVIGNARKAWEARQARGAPVGAV